MSSTEKAAAIARKMASMGFQPITSLGGQRHVEYVKDYEDRHGRRARVSCMFKRDPTGRMEAQLDGFVCTVQVHLSVLPEEVTKKAPPLVRPDLLEIIAQLGDGVGPASMAMIEQACATCGREAAEFYVIKGDAYCRSCHAKASPAG